MKGVILAGGLGTRLLPLTKVTNKHLLPVYHKPMIYYPLETLADAGILDIMLVTGGTMPVTFSDSLATGTNSASASFTSPTRKERVGIADALSLARYFSEGDSLMVILGDNIVEKSIRPFVERFQERGQGAKILLKEVPDPERFGVPELSSGQVIRIDEKPQRPASKYAVTGIYMYDQRVFDIIDTLSLRRGVSWRSRMSTINTLIGAK